MTTIAEASRTEKPGASAVPDEVLEHLRVLLDENHQVLLRRSTELVDDIEDLQTATATSGQGETEHVGSDVELGMTMALEANTLAALEDIAFALARMDDGSYGVCTACGVPIGVERLLAVPEARCCVVCQEREERGL